MIFWLEFEGRLTIIAMLFYVRNPIVVSIYFTPRNLSKSDHSCFPFLYEKSNRCFNDFLLQFEGNLTIIAILFLAEKSNRFVNGVLA